jgi:hypothetical protein
MKTPRFLYHGTTEKAARIAMFEGIRPRGEHGRSNWKRTIESNPDAVYLTDAYPLYFAFNAAKEGERGAVIEIDVEKLPQYMLVPDEDVLEQAGRGKDAVKGNMKARTRWYRRRLKEWISTENWKVSLEAMGTCAFLGTVPPEAITQVALVDPKRASSLMWSATDAVITLMNYRFCGPKYRNLTKRLFGYPTEPDDMNITPEMIEQQPTLQQIVDQRKAYEEALAADYATIEIIDANTVDSAAAA